jgi:hypothetical protein
VPEQDLSAGGKTDLALEIAHILFIDTVGYSKLTLGQQRQFQELFKLVVRRKASVSRRMAVAFLLVLVWP